MSLSAWVPLHVQNLAPVRYGPPPDGPGIVALAANESAFGASPAVTEAISQALSGIHLYPDPGGFQLKQRLAERHGVSPEQIVLGNGSGEVIELALKALVAPGERVVMARLGFLGYRLSSLAAGARLVEVPADSETHRIEPEDLLAAAAGAQMVFLANPNNPTGTYWSRSELERYFAQAPVEGVTVVDEAYAEYVEEGDYPAGLDYLCAGHPVLVLRTFSKIFGLAGARLGYGIASAELAGLLERVRSPFNTSLLAQQAALAALDDTAHLEAVRQMNRRERDRLQTELARRGAKVTPSVANFLLVEGPMVAAWPARLLRQGVLVRDLGGWGLPGAVRITVGTPEQNGRLLAALDRLEPGA